MIRQGSSNVPLIGFDSVVFGSNIAAQPRDELHINPQWMQCLCLNEMM